MKINALTVEETAEVLMKADPSMHMHVTVEDIKRDLESGAPVNSDGTINFIVYTAYFLSNWKGNEK
jgi:hypothetical protein